MNNREQVLATLAKWQFPVVSDDEVCVAFRYQMKLLRVWLQNDGDNMIVTLGGLYKAENEDETRMALDVCNELNAKLMQVKLYIDDDGDLTIASEFFFRREDDVGYHLELACRNINNAKKHFVDKMREAEDNRRILDELNQD